MKVTIVPIVIGAFGTVAKGLLKGLEDLKVGGLVETIQTTTIIRTARILRKVLEVTCCHSGSSERPSTKADVKSSQLIEEKIGLVSLLNSISTLLRLFNAKAILLEEQKWCYLTHSWEDKGVHTFPKWICPKVNVIARLEYELAYYDSAVHRFNHYTTRTPPRENRYC